ncbi:hypothetical protein OG874_35550 [Nocardia sp. NBC_00565]|uniref:hypothetical protein n=1 Tax=Nocardia sp. NBC_00565 TaxID=2975993 RepID=UPI002E81B403|nr:hypothetical protein [Nocardia sp. NBC_00565]WUC02006.1 hypothetical protein OG874_35550 [Nocardia sp. NBC_00565]
MTEPLENLERHIDGLRTEVRRAAMSGDLVRARELRADLRRAERAWDEALAALTAPEDEPEDARKPVSILPIRDQVHQALTLLSVPSAPKMIAAVQDAFFAGELTGSQLASLRRDEERSFRSSPHARPYYLCSALAADRLVSARGLVAVSTWPLNRRVVGPLSARVDFLISAVQVAEQIERLPEPTLPASRLLWRFATSIPGAAASFDAVDPATVAAAGRCELEIHRDADRTHREEAASRARTQLDEIEQMFGSSLKVVSRSTTAH